MAALERAARRGQAAAQYRGDDAAVAAGHLPLRERMLRMAREPGVVHALDRRVLLEEARDGERVAQWRSMRSASVLMPRSVRNESNGPGTPPTAFCR